MEKDSIYNSYNLFKIPQIKLQAKSIKKKKIVIGLIDASGSMGTFWPAMSKFWNQKIAPQADILITFSQKAKVQLSTKLNDNLSAHGGGMTNILDAFIKLEEQLINLDQTASITVVFISDGDDTVNGGNLLLLQLQGLKGGIGRDISFICLGIQSGFPTKIAIKLRQLYHTGDQAIAAIYLIEYASQKAFFNKFQTISNCFKVPNSIKVQIGGDLMKQYPWKPNGTVDFKQGKWIMVHKQFLQIQILYNQQQKRNIQITPLKQILLDDLVDCFRGWVQKVQVLSMDNTKIQETKNIATIALQTMTSYTLEYQAIFNIFILNQRKDIKQSFKDRAMGLAVKNTGSRIKWYIDQLAIISKGVGIGQLNQYDAAKRLGIGTITGKYHQKALALKGITVKDFLQIKQEFEVAFKNTKLSKQQSQQQCSIFTLQNQKQVFEQPDFLQGLQFCKSQYDLVQTFPVVGYGLKIKRYDGSMINPWKVRLLSLAKTHKTIDSMYLARNNNKYQLSIGNDQTEQINAVLPLFGKQDIQMSDLLNTRLFKLAVSFMTVQNIDTYHEQAYLALLGSTYIYLLKQPQSSWRTDLLNSIYTSLKITYGATQQFQGFIYSIQENPYNLWKDKVKQDHVDIVKILILIFYISREGRISQQKINHLVDLALVHYCEKTYVQNQFKIFRIADLKIQQIKIKQNINKEDKKDNQIFQELQSKNTIKGIPQLRTNVQKKMKQFINIDNMNVILNDKIFIQQDQQRRVTYSMIESFYKMLTNKQLNKQKQQILYFFGHYLKGVTQENYLQPVMRDMKIVQKNVLLQFDLKNFGSLQGKQMKSLKSKIQGKFLDHFRATHFGILPLKKQYLIKQCQKHNISLNSLHFNESTGLLRNACMSPDCAFYLQPMTKSEFIDHLRLWRGQMPARFHSQVIYQLSMKKTPQQICESAIKSNLVNLKKVKKTEEFVKNYIIKIGEALSSHK